MKPQIIKISLLAIAITVIGLGLGIGSGVVLQQQEESPVLIAQENVSDVEQNLSCQCEVTREDLLTETDVLGIVSENRDVLKGEKGDQGDKGDIGSTGPEGPQGMEGPRGEGQQGSIGLQGPKGDKGDEGGMPVGKWERYCLANDGVLYEFPTDNYYGVYYEFKVPLDNVDWCESCGVLTKDGITQLRGKCGRKVHFWVKE